MTRKRSVLCLLLLLTLPALTPALAQTIDDGRYAILSRHSGLALDIASASGDNGANVQQWGYSGGEHQQFDVTYRGDGYYSIQPVHSGKSLDVYNRSLEVGGEIRQREYRGDDGQLWSINDSGDGYVTVTSRLSGMNLDVWGWSTESGGDIRQWTPEGGHNQQWRFQPVAVDCASGPVDGGLYRITNLGSGLSLDVAAGSTDKGANLQQWGYGGGDHQQFTIRATGDGYWRIVAAHSGLALDVDGYSSVDGANVLQWEYLGGANQQWQFVQSPAGGYNIRARHSGLSLTATGGGSGDNIVQAADTASRSQRWQITPLNLNCAGDTGGEVDGFAAQYGPDGLATTTGGGSATPTVVTSCSALESALEDGAPRVVHIPDNTTIDCRTPAREQQVCQVQCSGRDKFTYRVPVGTQSCTELGSDSDDTVTRHRNDRRIHVASNKTLLGLGSGSRVLGASFVVSDVQNLIFRNFTLEDINPHLVEAGGGFSMDNASHIWIDHMRFRQISDGYTDMRSAKNVTLSWNHFDGYNTAACDNHHNYTMFADDTTATFHHNFYDRVGGRNPKLSKSETRVHLFNNYWYDVTYFSTNTSSGAQALIEGNYYENASRPHWNEAGKSGYIEADLDSSRYVGSSAEDPYRHADDSVFGDIELYPYTLDNVDELPAVLRNGTGPQ